MKPDFVKAAAIMLSDRKVLSEKSEKKGFYLFPGGKVEPEESIEAALIRELEEELTISVSDSDLSEYWQTTEPAAGNPDKIMEIHVFLVKNWQGTINPSNEVDQITWLNSKLPSDLPVSSVLSQTIQKLASEGLID